MKISLTNTNISKLTLRKNRYDVWDEKLTGFYIRVSPGGKKTYRCFYRHEGVKKNITIGSADVLNVSEAREKARAILGKVADGIDPNFSKTSRKKEITLKQFIDAEYASWREISKKAGKEEIARIRANFLDEFGDYRLIDIIPLNIERWRVRRLKNKIMPTTINRDVSALRTALFRAQDWEFIENNPLSKLKPIPIEKGGIVRYLEVEEEKRLRIALDARIDEMSAARKRADEWRKDRGYDERGSIAADYLKPMVLIAINTGLRRGELFGITWSDVNFKKSLLTIPASISKSKRARHIPLNDEAYMIIKEWYNIAGDQKFIFTNKDGKKFTTIKKAWESLKKKAKIKNFRWHDFRHHFASKLVMASVDLNTVRELLGHADMHTTLRYAHLTPEHKANAVSKLQNPLKDSVS